MVKVLIINSVTVFLRNIDLNAILSRPGSGVAIASTGVASLHCGASPHTRSAPFGRGSFKRYSRKPLPAARLLWIKRRFKGLEYIYLGATDCALSPMPRLCWFMRIALYEPDIPLQNGEPFSSLAACLGVPVDVIEPCGFVPMTASGGSRLRRTQEVALTRPPWRAFGEKRVDGPPPPAHDHGRRGAYDFAFGDPDTLLLGARAPACRTTCIMRSTRKRLIVLMAGAVP